MLKITVGEGTENPPHAQRYRFSAAETSPSLLKAAEVLDMSAQLNKTGLGTVL